MKIQKKSEKGMEERGFGAEKGRERTGKKWMGPCTWHVPWALQHGDPALFRSNQISSTEVDWDT